MVLDMVYKRWVGILVVGDVDMRSALDARGDGGEFLVGLGKTGNVDILLVHTLS